ncbi:hypothetical protein QJS10_CPB21g01365 [Acorus calamus]|uniref:Uncharacterized protein n=1 Tax=Acorus calamus TaxID=4465 RepID=A0AAV9C3Z5_ACOCL|nr:hypothetical protein QJS10_CPB21g01365 [Acorus calamus]
MNRSKRRQNSSKHSTNSLDPVEEDAPWHESGRDPKLRKVSEYELAPDLGKAPGGNWAYSDSTPKLEPLNRQDNTINQDVESLDSLASGMNRRRAAMLFYQTCGRTIGSLRRDLPVQGTKYVEEQITGTDKMLKVFT